MNISYQREMKRNYLIINGEKNCWKSYECQMMEANNIDGLLRFQVRQVDGEVQYYYEITSKQPLGRFLENRTLSGGEIRTLVMEIGNALNKIELYLLREERVLLEPNYIYVEPETLRIWLCFVPGIERDFSQSYGKLLEYFLGKVDHKDKESVVLAYGLYQETRKENYGMEDVLKLLYRENNVEQKVVAPVQAQREELLVSKPVEEKKLGIWSKLAATIKGEKKKTVECEFVQPMWSELFTEEAKPEVRNVLVEENRERVENTVLLYESTGVVGMRKLVSVDGGGEDIHIAYYPFIIGKQDGLVDYVLNGETVSRLHLRVDRQGEAYCLTDLNSTNGTIVGGILLSNNEAVTIFPGTEVEIAQYRYRFE